MMLALSARPLPIATAVVGAVIVLVSSAWARRDAIHPLERAVFRAVNGLPGWAYWALWIPMQCGNLVVGVLAGVAVALWLGDVAVAVASVVAAVCKLVAERVVRTRVVAYAAVRQRPGTSEPGAVLRGHDVPAAGVSFPSGHVILAAAVASVVASVAPAGWLWVPWVLVVLVMLGRVYVGAHNPLDVTAGLGAGMLIGGLLDVLLR